MNLIAQEPCQADDSRLIPLSRGLFATVSLIDYVWLSQWKWCATSTKSANIIYAARNEYTKGGKKCILMHRQILDLSADPNIQADHIDGNGLNNSRSNLRIATRSQNLWNQPLRSDNTSGFKGVSFNKHRRYWRARIYVRRKCIYAGEFATKEEAAKAYCDAAKRLHGEFAYRKYVIPPMVAHIG